MFVNILLHVKQQHHPQAIHSHRDGGVAKRNTTRDVMAVSVRVRVSGTCAHVHVYMYMYI